MLTARGLAVALPLICTIIAAPLRMDPAVLLSNKIKEEAMDIKDSMNLNEDYLKLEVIRRNLRIFPLSLEQCENGSIIQGDCYIKFLNGLKTMYSLLNSTSLHDLTDLRYDLLEFITMIEEKMNGTGLSVVPPSPQEWPNNLSDYQKEAGVFLILHDLCDALSTFQKGVSNMVIV